MTGMGYLYIMIMAIVLLVWFMYMYATCGTRYMVLFPCFIFNSRQNSAHGKFVELGTFELNRDTIDNVRVRFANFITKCRSLVTD